MAKSPHLTRNEFVKTMVAVLGTVMGVVVGLPAVGYLLTRAVLEGQTSDAWVPLGPLENYPVGTPQPCSALPAPRSTAGSAPPTATACMSIGQTKPTPWLFSNVCTHLACRVKWQEDQQDIYCPCHDAHFALKGRSSRARRTARWTSYANKVEERHY